MHQINFETKEYLWRIEWWLGLNAMTTCCFELQDSGESPSMMKNPEIDFRPSPMRLSLREREMWGMEHPSAPTKGHASAFPKGNGGGV